MGQHSKPNFLNSVIHIYVKTPHTVMASPSFLISLSSIPSLTLSWSIQRCSSSPSCNLWRLFVNQLGCMQKRKHLSLWRTSHYCS